MVDQYSTNKEIYYHSVKLQELALKSQPFWKYEIYGEPPSLVSDVPATEVYDYHLFDTPEYQARIWKLWRFERRCNRISIVVQLLTLIALFLYSAVWLNEELLLVLSFVLLYVKGFEPLRYSYEEFIVPRIMGLVWNKLVKRTEIIFKKIRFNLIATYFTSLNTALFVKANLQRNFAMLVSSNEALHVLRYNLYIAKLNKLIMFDTTYCNTILLQELQYVHNKPSRFPVLACRDLNSLTSISASSYIVASISCN